MSLQALIRLKLAFGLNRQPEPVELVANLVMFDLRSLVHALDIYDKP
jgi:hypothetical protein